MDRDIDPSFRRKRILRRIAFALVAGCMAGGTWVWASGWIKPSVARSRVRTATVERGQVESTIAASGTVVPEFEQVLSSPVSARILKILKRPGDVLAKGDPILQLDVSGSVLALDRLDQDLAIKRNDQLKTRLDLDKTLADLENQREIKDLEYQTLKAKAAQHRALFRQGLLSQEAISQTELAESTARLQLQQIEQSKRAAERENKTRVDGLGLEMRKLEGDRAAAQRELDLATTRSDRDGVLTWVVAEEGSTVQQGAVIAKIADLRSFRVDATVSDVHAGRLAVGLPVRIIAGEQTLEGRVATVLPTIQNGIVTVAVSLDDKADANLRSNLRVDALIVTDRKDAVLRVRKGSYARGEGLAEVFVVRGDRAFKTSVRFGISGFDDLEVVDGLVEGDEIIVTDMTDYLYLKEVSLK